MPYTANRMTSRDKQIGRNIALARDLRGMNNGDLARKLGRHGTEESVRNWVQERLTGKRPLTISQLEAFSHALDVPERVLMGEPQWIMRYFSEHPELIPDLDEQQSRWIPELAGHSTR